MTNTASEEQKQIIKRLKNYNVVVDSVAGSGKTTTSLFIAQKYSDERILLLTYNAKLKLETRERVKSLNINNMEVHSYHSFCVKYYNHKCFTDSEITQLLESKTKPLKKFAYDIIILDEAQDITKIYYEIFCKLSRDNKKYAKLCIMGDKYQSIYAFNKADSRYITYAQELFPLNDLNWKCEKLSISFRATKPLADFVNHCILGYSRIKSIKESTFRPRYLICDAFIKPNGDRRTFNELKYYLNLGYKPDEIFILAPSLKSIKSPVRTLENYIKTELPDILVYVPISDDEHITHENMENKIVFSTFHQVKGLERKVVMVYNFDSSFFTYYSTSKDTICPNEIYVAATRATERITFIHHRENNYFEFLNKNNLRTYADVYGNNPKTKKKRQVKCNIKSVIDMVKFLPSSVIDKCFDYLDVEIIKQKGKRLYIQNQLYDENVVENVFDINGIAIPAYFEYTKTGQMTILKYCLHPTINDNKKLFNFWKGHLPRIKKINCKANLSIKDVLYLSLIYASITSGYIFKICQIKSFNWIENKVMDKCLKRLGQVVENIGKARFEIEIEILPKGHPELMGYKLYGTIDCVDEKILYEFKCVEKLQKHHYLQLALYMYMYQIINPGVKKRYILYNVLNNKTVEIKCEFSTLKKMVEYLFIQKFLNTEENNENFKKENEEILAKYFDFEN